MAALTLDRVTCMYAEGPRPAVNDVSLHINDGEFFALTGPPGGGKTTLLRAIAGIEECASGSIFLNGDDITAVPPPMRNVTMVFQHYALYPHMSVYENMGFALQIAGLPEDEVHSRVLEAAQVMDLLPHLYDKPTDLTRAERQRVALGRAVVRRPGVYLMDEPLVNMNDDVRQATKEQIIRLQERTGVTTVYAATDCSENLDFADRVGLMVGGQLQHVGSPAEIAEIVALSDMAVRG